jgi:hypothetical protein
MFEMELLELNKVNLGIIPLMISTFAEFKVDY